MDVDIDTGLRLEICGWALCFAHEDRQKMMSSFLNKGKQQKKEPNFLWDSEMDVLISDLQTLIKQPTSVSEKNNDLTNMHILLRVSWELGLVLGYYALMMTAIVMIITKAIKKIILLLLYLQ